MTEKQKKLIAGGGLLAFLALSLLVFWFAGRPLIQFVSQPDRFRQWVDEQGIWGPLAFVGMVILQIIVAIIPGEPLEIAAGYAFGFWEGIALCILGMTIGGVLVFALVRRFGRPAAEVFFSREKLDSLRFLQHKRRVSLVLVLVFLLPGTPKDILSYAAGLTPVKFSHWLLITSLCRLPSVITSTMGGSALGRGELLTAVIVFAATLAVSLTGYLLYRRLHRNSEQ